MNKRSRMSRRDFVQGRFWQGDASEPGRPVASTSDVMRYPRTASDVADPSVARHALIPVLRPPGAIEEFAFLSGCTKCEACIDACPHDAITKAPERMRAAAGTPMLEPDIEPCRMCEDTPCITACEPGVLTDRLPTMMGTAIITAHLCVAHHGSECAVCSEQCPVDGAIENRDEKPFVDESKCTGCGVCRHVCPAPENAILLMPTFARPLPSSRPNK